MTNNKDANIEISIVVPAYNEEHLLSLCLESLKNQDFKGRYEIIVVDNNSTDNTKYIVEKYNAKYLLEKRKGVAFARDRGFREARGKIIASTDADTIVPINWFTKIISDFNRDSDIVAITGPIDFFGQTKKRLMILNIFAPITRVIGKIASRNCSLRGANLAIKKDIFERIGGFDSRLVVGEDVDLGIHAREFGKIFEDKYLRVKTSARKFEFESASAKGFKGLLKTYLFNFWWLMFFKKPMVNELKDVRTFGEYEIISQKKLKTIRIIGYTTIIAVIIITVCAWGAFQPKSQIFGKTYWGVKTKEKVIALTFDDGPNEPYTSQILNILDRYNIKATFFVLGENVTYYPETVQKINNSGNIIANHSYSHQSDLSIEDKTTLNKEINWSQNAIYKTIGMYPHLFRPPHGFKSPWLLTELKKDNLITVEWSDMVSDWRQPPVDEIVNGIIKKAKPGGVIVLHDGDETKHGSNRSQEVKALPAIIEKLQEKGYRFVTIPELFNVPAYNI
jgi:peptidoglycan/xylan/chitin deacetylase (PgdA/CDA1 family)/glycosyltransferase involved in cell wall biosynthesis